jgi:DNA-binding NarL/FixJ family response regulator
VLRIELEGLSDEAVTELAAAAGLDPGPVVAAVGGNPFYLTEQLTDRQLEVLALLAKGWTNAEIAARLYLSQRTVDNHVAALLARLGVSSRHDALAVATDLGLLDPPAGEPWELAVRSGRPPARPRTR